MRKKEIDLARGIGILLVVLGHSNISSITHKFIYSFHMPLFFMISGYLYDEEKYKDNTLNFVKKKFNSYIVPYFYLCFINLFLVSIELIKNNNLKKIFKHLIGIIYSRGTTEWLPNCSPLWFLTCIFCTEIIFYLINKKNNKWIYLLFCMVLGYLIYLNLTIKLFWNIDTALISIVYIFVGNLIKKYKILEKIKCTMIIVLLSIGIIFILLNNYNVDFDANEYGNIAFMYIASISMSLVVLKLAFYIKNNCILEFLGRNTIIIIGFNYFILSISNRVLNKFYFNVNILKVILNYSLQLILLFIIIIIYNSYKIKKGEK